VDPDERRFRDEQDREAPPQGARLVTAILPDGRLVRLAVPAPLAPANTVSHLAREAQRRARQSGVAIARQRSAIGQLARAIAADTERLSAAQAGRAAAIRRRLVTRYKRLDTRVTEAVTEFRGRVERQLKIERESVRRLGRRDLWDKIVIASSLPLFAAYGQQGQLSNTTNLALTLSLLIWLVGDEVVQTLFGSEEKSLYPWRDTDIWSYLAPLGNVLTAWWLFGDRQNDRFVTGVTTVKVGVDATATPGQLTFPQSESVDLSPRVALDHRPDFETFRGVPVVATVGATRLTGLGGEVHGVHASVRKGTLHLSFNVVTPAPVAGRPASLGEVDIAWIVDTAEPPTTPS
jgi:hypothetical protein